MLALVIDDDVRLRKALCEEIRRQRVFEQVLATGLTSEGANRLQQYSPDVVFLDLAVGRRFDMLACRGIPPVIVPLSSDDEASIRELRSVGVTAWMKPEVFSELDHILIHAQWRQHDASLRWKEWIEVARHIAGADTRPVSRVCAFDGDQQVLVDLAEVLAGRTTGRATELAITDRVVQTPYPLELISDQRFRELFRGRVVISRKTLLKGVFALVRLYTHALRSSRTLRGRLITDMTFGATIVDKRACSGGVHHARRHRK